MPHGQPGVPDAPGLPHPIGGLPPAGACTTFTNAAGPRFPSGLSETHPETPLAARLIDVWDVETFGPELTACLTEHADLMAGYYARSNKILLDHDLGRARTLIRPDNEFAAAFGALIETVTALMDMRTIRA